MECAGKECSPTAKPSEATARLRPPRESSSFPAGSEAGPEGAQPQGRPTGPMHDSGPRYRGAGKAAPTADRGGHGTTQASRERSSHRSHRGAIVGREGGSHRAGRVRPARLSWPAPAMGWGWGCYGQPTLWPAHDSGPRYRGPVVFDPRALLGQLPLLHHERPRLAAPGQA